MNIVHVDDINAVNSATIPGEEAVARTARQPADASETAKTNSEANRAPASSAESEE
jgi:hypothetical protein